MNDPRIGSYDDLIAESRKDPEYIKAERKIRPIIDISAQINARRHHLKITQNDLATRAKTYQSRVSKIERGEFDVRLSTLIEIAEALECELNIQFVPYNDEAEKDYSPLLITPIHMGKTVEIKSSNIRFSKVPLG